MKYLFKSLLILYILNIIIGLHYFKKVTNFPLTISIITATVYLFILILKPFKSIMYNNGLVFSLILLYIFTFYLIFKIYPKEALGTDRWSDITNFWNFYFDNKLGFSARSHLGNRITSMPFMLYLALPFYLAEIIDFFSFACIPILFYSFSIEFKEQKISYVVLTSLFFSIILYIEFLVRSNILLNSSIILLFSIRLINLNEISLNKLVITGVIWGLILASRMIFILPFLLIIVYLFNRKILNLKTLFFFGFIVFVSFTLIFLPLIYGHLDQFVSENPFIAQNKISKMYLILLILFSIILGFRIKERIEIYFWISILLIISSIFSAFYVLDFKNFYYSTISIPFLLYHIRLFEAKMN